METERIIDLLDSRIGDPSMGLPEDIFLFASRITPLLNVDLLIRDDRNQTLLTWRDDGYYPPGWHIPGGIVRFKEKIRDRILAVARNELGIDIELEEDPLAINEVIHPSRRVRGHFISLLYRCRPAGPPDDRLRYDKGIPLPGQWAWHRECPPDIIPVHEMYRRFI